MAFKSRFFAALTSDHAALAQTYLEEGNKARAAEAFARAGRFGDAARLAAETGNASQAVRYTLSGVLGAIPAGMEEATPQQAGELLASSGHHKEALVLFELGMAWKQAAESAAKLQLAGRAGRYYEKARLWRLAALYYRRAGQASDAVRVLELESKRLKEEGRARREAGVEQAISEVDQERAELLGKLGKGGEASAVLTGSMPTLRVGKLHEAAGRIEEAVRAYAAVGEKDDALRLLPRAQRFSADEKARLLLSLGRAAEAAQAFAAAGALREASEAWEQAGELAVAAKSWESAGDPGRAAAAYRRAGLWNEAGRLYEAAGDVAKAGESFLMAKEYRRAGDSLLKAGKAFEAATCYLQVQAKEEASLALRRVRPGTREGAKATMLLVPLLYEQGKFSDALQRLQMLPPATDPGGRTIVEQLYWQARLLERLERQEEAIVALVKLLAIQPDYRDAPARLAHLRSGTSNPLPAAGTPTLATPVAAPATEAAPIPRPLRRSGAGAFGPGALLAGRYEILAEIGRGGMGRVYRARDRELGEEIAIKTILGRGDDTRGEEERLLREVQLLRRLTHVNIVRVHDLGRFDDGIFVTMELVDGLSLDQLLKSTPVPPLDRTRAILSQIAAGLAEAHAHGIVHRDLKPGNVMLTPTRVKILDFGIARAIHSDDRLTVTGLAVGTPLYMSPEQIQGAALDGRSDLYALGVLAFTMLVGREPFRGPTPTAIAIDHLQSNVPDLGAMRPGLPSPWIDLTMRLLAKEAARRPRSAEEVVDALGHCPV